MTIFLNSVAESSNSKPWVKQIAQMMYEGYTNDIIFYSVSESHPHMTRDDVNKVIYVLCDLCPAGQ